MKRLVISIILAFTVLASIAGNALAAPRTPEADTFVDHQSANQGTNYNGQDLRIAGSQDPGGTCTATRTALLRFNLSDVNTTIGSAILTLTTESAGSTNANGRQIALFRVADDTWDEATVTYLTAPAVGAQIPPSITLPDPISGGLEVQFTGTALVTYLNEQVAGDKKASFAVRFVTCAQTSTQRFGDKETGVSPKLELFTPNSVAISTFATDTPAPTWPLYAGLAALAVIAAAGVAWSRRRATQQ